MTAPGEPLPATYGEHLMSVDTPVTSDYHGSHIDLGRMGIEMTDMDGTRSEAAPAESHGLSGRRAAVKKLALGAGVAGAVAGPAAGAAACPRASKASAVTGTSLTILCRSARGATARPPTVIASASGRAVHHCPAASIPGNGFGPDHRRP